MQVEISKTDNYYQIRIPINERYTNHYIRRFMDYLKIKSIAEKSAVTDEDIGNLSEEIMVNWWEKNKSQWDQVWGQGRCGGPGTVRISVEVAKKDYPERIHSYLYIYSHHPRLAGEVSNKLDVYQSISEG